MNLVDLDRVSLRYGEDDEGTLALHRATLQVSAGEFVAVVGPSGCGKSTLMKVVTGLWPATAGTVLVSGRNVVEPLSIVGMAFQNPTLLPWRTTLANVMLPLEIVKPHCKRLKRERAAYEAKARDLLALVGLKGFEDHFPWQLSGGMQQRASLCRALIHDPSLLMLDEPFASLDMFTQGGAVARLAGALAGAKPTVILVTHDLREAALLSDRVLVMSARPGRIVAERVVDLPRPRTLEMTYDPYSVAFVHELREHISSARSNATPRREVAVSASDLIDEPPLKRRKPFLLRRKTQRRVLPWVVIILLFALWEAVVRLFAVEPFLLPAPSAMFAAGWQWRWPILDDAWQTFMTTAVGFLIAVAFGLVAGVAIGSSTLVYDGFYPALIGFNTNSEGGGDSHSGDLVRRWHRSGHHHGVPAVVLSHFGECRDRIATLEPELRDVLRALGASRWQVIQKVGLPRSMPYFFASLKVAITVAFVGSIVAETVAANKGIGHLMLVASSRFEVPLAFAGLLVTSVMGSRHVSGRRDS